jgi:hypothetical protein
MHHVGSSAGDNTCYPNERMDIPKELRESGLKATLPRLPILQLFHESKTKHLSAEDVYRLLLDERIDVGPKPVVQPPIMTAITEAPAPFVAPAPVPSPLPPVEAPTAASAAAVSAPSAPVIPPSFNADY